MTLRALLLITLALLAIAPIRAAAAPPESGRAAPAISLRDVDGRLRSLAHVRGRPAVLCFFCGCRACRAFAAEWARVQRSSVAAVDGSPKPGASPAGERRSAVHVPLAVSGTPKPVASPATVIVYSGTAAELRAFARDAALDSSSTTLLPDPGGRTTRQYDALPCPRICVLDANGRVRGWIGQRAGEPPAAASALVARVLSALGKPPAGIMRTKARPSAPPAASALIVAPAHGVIRRQDGAQLDFGSIDRVAAPVVSKTVTVRNGGRVTATISRVQTSCACVDAGLLLDGERVSTATLAPGAEVDVRLALDVRELSPGPVQKVVWLFADGEAAPALTIEVNAATEAPVKVAPAALEFGRIPAGSRKAITVTATVDRRLLPQGAPPKLVSSNPSVQVSAGRAVSGPNGQGSRKVFSYRATFLPTAPIGALTGVVRLTLAGSAPAGSAAPAEAAVRAALHSDGEIAVPIRGEVVGDITAVPSVLNLGVTHPGRDRPQCVDLVGASSRAPVVTRIRCSAAWLAAVPAPPVIGQRSSRRTLQVSIGRGAPAGPVTAEIHVTTATGLRLVVPVTAYIVP
jgi:hypothetical protein